MANDVVVQVDLAGGGTTLRELTDEEQASLNAQRATELVGLESRLTERREHAEALAGVAPDKPLARKILRGDALTAAEQARVQRWLALRALGQALA
jgi:hypothetical protein